MLAHDERVGDRLERSRVDDNEVKTGSESRDQLRKLIASEGVDRRRATLTGGQDRQHIDLRGAQDSREVDFTPQVFAKSRIKLLVHHAMGGWVTQVTVQ